MTNITSMIVLLLFAGVIVGAGHQPSKATRSPKPMSITVNGHPIDRVMLDDRLVNYARYKSVIEPSANANGDFLSLVIDSSAVDRGYFVAFTSAADSNRYMAQHGMLPRTERVSPRIPADMRLADDSSSRSVLNGRPIRLAACGSTNNFAIMYDGLSCTGQTLSMLARDIINDFSDYGFDNKASSLWLGRCIVTLKLFTNDNLTGTSTSFGGGDTFYSAIPNGNSASSGSTPGSNC